MARKAKKVPLPNNWKRLISDITGLNFCDKQCGCGEANAHWWFPVCGQPEDWVPGWMNGVGTDEVWDWLVENGRTKRPK